ncbi:MAG: hypothetical protein ABI946_04450 [Chthoniobacterales bacterium]
MRLLSIFSLALATCLIGCAEEGVIVQKNSGPQPLYHSIGIDGSYAFLLRDNAGTVHRQLVTPEVFERYAVGEFFNDLQASPAPREMSDSKAMVTAMRPVAAASTIAKTKKISKSNHIASRKHTARKRVAHRSKSKHRPATKIARKHSAPKVAQFEQPPILIVSAGRCR